MICCFQFFTFQLLSLYSDYLCTVVTSVLSVVTIGFNLEEYASNEDELMISSIVRKSEIRMAHPVSLRVQPLTVADAQAMGVNIPPVEGNLNIEENTSMEQTRIPIRAKCKCKVCISILTVYFMPCIIIEAKIIHV